MSNIPAERRQQLRANGWYWEDQAAVWCSGDGWLVKVFLPSGVEAEARLEHRLGCDSYDRGPDNIIKPCNCKPDRVKIAKVLNPSGAKQPGSKKPETLDLECPKCGGGTSVNFKNGKPYDYCPECGWSNRPAALGHNQGRPAGVADDEPNPYNH